MRRDPWWWLAVMVISMRRDPWWWLSAVVVASVATLVVTLPSGLC